MQYKFIMATAMLVIVGISSAFLAQKASTSSVNLQGTQNLQGQKAQNNKKDFCVYMIYTEGAENDYGSYTQTVLPPTPCGGHDALCYFRICGDDDGTISDTEFGPAFDAFDTNDDQSLDDETEVTGVLEKFTNSK